MMLARDLGNLSERCGGIYIVVGGTLRDSSKCPMDSSKVYRVVFDDKLTVVTIR